MTVNSNFTPGQVLTASQLNSSFGSAASQTDMAQIQNGTAPDAGTLTGSETLAASRGAGLLQTTPTKIAQFVTDTYSVDWLNTTGSVPASIYNFFSQIATASNFNIVGDGSDETAKCVNAITYSATHGIRLDWQGKTIGFTNINALVGGGVINWTGVPKFTQLAARDNTTPGFQVGGAPLATVALASTALAGSYQITLSDASAAQPGYTIRLLTNKLAFGDHRFDPNNAIGQLVKIKAVSGNVVTLFDPLVFDLPVGMITTGTAQAGTTTNITLSASDASTASQLNNYLLTITASTGAGQSRYINTYNATTKVADIGTTYTSFPQAPWTTAPDATSQYSVAATCSAQIIQPGYVKSLGDMTVTGFATSGLFVYGVQLQYCDRPLIDGVAISNFSRMALYTRFNYFPKVVNSHFDGANEATSGGGGLGYGHSSLGDYGCMVENCSATGCRTGFDSINGSMFVSHRGCKVVGGGLAYDGNPFWPAPSGYPNSGISNHTGTFGVSDIGNEMIDVWDNKNRAYWHVAHNNVIRGQVNYPFYIFYTTGGDYRGNTYEDGMTAVPSSGMNANVNGTETPVTNASIVNRAISMFYIQQAGLVPYATVTIDGNRAKSSTLTGVYLGIPDSAGTLGLYVTNNDIDVVANSANSCSVINGDTGTIGLRDLKIANNELRAGGSALGNVKVSSMTKYPIISQISTSTPFVVQIGVSKYLCILPNNTAADVVFPRDQSTFSLTVFEKDAAVTNYFSGIVTRGNTTPVLLSGSSGAALSVAALTGSTGTSGNITISNRSTDGRFILENRSGSTGRFIVSVEGIMN
jgi:hypothetical protein